MSTLTEAGFLKLTEMAPTTRQAYSDRLDIQVLLSLGNHSSLRHLPPAEYEKAYIREINARLQPAVGRTRQSLNRDG